MHGRTLEGKYFMFMVAFPSSLCTSFQNYENHGRRKQGLRGTPHLGMCFRGVGHQMLASWGGLGPEGAGCTAGRISRQGGHCAGGGWWGPGIRQGLEWPCEGRAGHKGVLLRLCVHTKVILDI